MYLKKKHTLTLGLMLTTLLSNMGQALEEAILADVGIKVNNSEEARRLHARPEVVGIIHREVIPSGEPIRPIEFLTAHDAALPGTPTREVIQQHKAVTGLRSLGIEASTPQEARNLWEQPGVAQDYKWALEDSGASVSVSEFLQVQQARPGASADDIVHQADGMKKLLSITTGPVPGAAAAAAPAARAVPTVSLDPSSPEAKASGLIVKVRLERQMAEYLPAAIYFQQNMGAHLPETRPNIRATKFLIDSGHGGPNDQEISMIAELVAMDKTLTMTQVNECLYVAGLYAAAGAPRTPSIEQIDESLRQRKLVAGNLPSLDDIFEGLRQKEVLKIKVPSLVGIKQGVRLSKQHFVCNEEQITAVVALCDDHGHLRTTPDQITAMVYILKTKDLNLSKLGIDFIDAVAMLRDPAKINIQKPNISHVEAVLRLGNLRDADPSKPRVIATAYLMDPDGINMPPHTLNDVDYVVYLQDVLKMDEPDLDHIQATGYLMDTRAGAPRIVAPSIPEIRATIYLNKPRAEGGLEQPAPTVPDIKAVAHLITPITLGGLEMSKPQPNDITAAQHLIALPFADFTTDDLEATVDLQKGHTGFPAIPLPNADDINAAKCLLGLKKLDYALEDFNATKYLQMNPAGTMAAPILSPKWDEIKGTIYLKKGKRAGGLHIDNPTDAQVKAVAYLQGVLGSTLPAYRAPSLEVLKGTVHLQSARINEQTPSDPQVRATALLQTPAPTLLGGFAGAGAILDADPSLERIDATAHLQDWQYPVGVPAAPPARPTLPLIDAVAKGSTIPGLKKEIAWAIQAGFAGHAVGTIPVAVGRLIECKDGFHFFQHFTIADTAVPPVPGAAPLPAAIELVRDRLFNHADGSFAVPGVTGFKVADANLPAGLHRVGADRKLAKGEYVVYMGLAPDLANPGCVLVTGAANHPG